MTATQRQTCDGPIYPDTYWDGPVASRPLSRDGDDLAATKAKHPYVSSMTVRKQRNKDGAVYFATFTCYQWIPLFQPLDAYDLV